MVSSDQEEMGSSLKAGCFQFTWESSVVSIPIKSDQQDTDANDKILEALVALQNKWYFLPMVSSTKWALFPWNLILQLQTQGGMFKVI